MPSNGFRRGEGLIERGWGGGGGGLQKLKSKWGGVLDRVAHREGGYIYILRRNQMDPNEIR